MSHKGRCFRGARRTKARKKRQAERRLLAHTAAMKVGRRHQRRVQAMPFLANRAVQMTIPNLPGSHFPVDFLGC